jgi:hypothetical protein
LALALAACGANDGSNGTTEASTSVLDGGSDGATSTSIEESIDAPATTVAPNRLARFSAEFVDGYQPPTFDVDLDTGVVTSYDRWFDSSDRPSLKPSEFSAELTACEVLAPGIMILRGDLDAAAHVKKARVNFHFTRVLLHDNGPATATSGGADGFDLEFDGSGEFAVLSDTRAANWLPDGRSEFFAYSLDLELTEILGCSLQYSFYDNQGELLEYVWKDLEEDVGYSNLITTWDAPAGSVQALGIDPPRVAAEIHPWEWVAWLPLAIPFEEVWAPDPAQAPLYTKFEIAERAGCLRLVQEFEGATMIQSSLPCPALLARRESTSETIGEFTVYADPDPAVTVVALDRGEELILIEGTDQALVETLALASAPHKNLVRLVTE